MRAPTPLADNKCPLCGASNYSTSAICGECSVKRAQSSNAGVHRKQRRNMFLVTLLVVGVTLLVAVYPSTPTPASTAIAGPETTPVSGRDVPASTAYAVGSSTNRLAIAAVRQKGYREEGCRSCRVWVTGPSNTFISILDPEADTTPNDYALAPISLYSVGFTHVTYYSAPGIVYAEHDIRDGEQVHYPSRDEILKACEAANAQATGAHMPCR